MANYAQLSVGSTCQEFELSVLVMGDRVSNYWTGRVG